MATVRSILRWALGWKQSTPAVAVFVVELTLATRSLELNLPARTLELTLDERDLDLTLEDR